MPRDYVLSIYTNHNVGSITPHEGWYFDLLAFNIECSTSSTILPTQECDSFKFLFRFTSKENHKDEKNKKVCDLIEYYCKITSIMKSCSISLLLFGHSRNDICCEDTGDNHINSIRSSMINWFDCKDAVCG